MKSLTSEPSFQLAIAKQDEAEDVGDVMGKFLLSSILDLCWCMLRDDWSVSFRSLVYDCDIMYFYLFFAYRAEGFGSEILQLHLHVVMQVNVCLHMV